MTKGRFISPSSFYVKLEFEIRNQIRPEIGDEKISNPYPGRTSRIRNTDKIKA
jgi:hypothetical protein